MSVITRIRDYTTGSARIIGIYYSASYCKWCTSFSPQLRSVYSYLNQYGIEIVMAGSDKTKEDYDDYAIEQCWPSMDYEDALRPELRRIYSINTIPALVFVNADGSLIDSNGRQLVVNALEMMYDAPTAARCIAATLGVEEASVDYDSDDSDF